MKIEPITRNQTDGSKKLYLVSEDNLNPIGTVEIVLSGPCRGTYYYALGYKYSRQDIEKFFKAQKGA